MNKDPTPRRPEDEHPAHGGDGEAGNEGRAHLRKKGRSLLASDARVRDCPQAGSPRSPFCVTIYPFHGPTEGVDVTDALVGAIALVLWKLHGGNEPVNRLEALVLLERAMGRTVARARA